MICLNKNYALKTKVIAGAISDKMFKKIKKKRSLILLVLILSLSPLVIAETTFYEGEEYFINQNPAQESGGGSGGGSGGYNPPTCNPLWVCEEWSSCSNNLRSRNCVDISHCNSNENPPLLLSCSLPLPSDRITGCIRFYELNLIIKGWKQDLYRFDILNSAINHWRYNLQC